MGIEWRPFDYNPETKRAFLTQLFQAGLKNQTSPDALCNIVRDIASDSAYDAEASTAMFEAILKNAPDCVTAWSGMAQGLRIQGKIQESLIAAKSGLKIAPERADLLTALGKLHHELHDYDLAIECFQSAMEQAPKQTISDFCTSLLQIGKMEECQRILDQYVTQYGHTTNTLALSCVLLMQAEDKNALDQILDFDRIQSSDQNDVHGSDVLTDMNSRIAKAVGSHPAMVFEPGSTATVKGKQTFLHQVLDEELIKFVIAMIQKQVEDYIIKMPDTAIMPAMPESLGITTWVVMLEEAGFQRPHIHPSGLLSGVYYVSAPDDGRDPESPGAIEFGRPPSRAMSKDPLKQLLIQPFEGQMLLFPSYFYHRTIPKKSATPRICISFDIH